MVWSKNNTSLPGDFPEKWKSSHGPETPILPFFINTDEKGFFSSAVELKISSIIGHCGLKQKATKVSNKKLFLFTLVFLVRRLTAKWGRVTSRYCYERVFLGKTHAVSLKSMVIAAGRLEILCFRLFVGKQGEIHWFPAFLRISVAFYTKKRKLVPLINGSTVSYTFYAYARLSNADVCSSVTG